VCEDVTRMEKNVFLAFPHGVEHNEHDGAFKRGLKPSQKTEMHMTEFEQE